MFFAEDRLPHVVKMILVRRARPEGPRRHARLKERLKEAKGTQAAEIAKELAAVAEGVRQVHRGLHGRAQEAAAHAARRLRRALQGDARPPGHHPHARPAAARVPAQARGADGAGRDAARPRARRRTRRPSRKRRSLLRAVEELHEFNPMLGHRGCRLGITYPEITRMQARAIFEAALQVAKKGIAGQARGHDPARRPRRGAAPAEEDRAGGGAARCSARTGSGVEYLIGTMIEVPRGALTADEIAKEAEFFSFGTNDLTQMGFGLSRDDAGKFLLALHRARASSTRTRSSPSTPRAWASSSRSACRRAAPAQAEPEDRRLRRARRRPVVDPLLPRRRPRLRVLLALPRAHRAPGRGAGPAREAGRRLASELRRCSPTSAASTGKIEQPRVPPGAADRGSEGACTGSTSRTPPPRRPRILEDPFHFHPLAIEDCLAGGPPSEAGRLRRLPLRRSCTASASTRPPTSSSPASWTSSWARTT